MSEPNWLRPRGYAISFSVFGVLAENPHMIGFGIALAILEIAYVIGDGLKCRK